MLKVILLSLILLVLAFAGMAIKLFFDRKASFRGGSCMASSPELENRGISCGCAGACASEEK